jgi:hypothetical protein
MANKRFDALEKMFLGKLGEEVNRLVMHIETNRAEFIDTRDSHENRL